MSTYTVKQREIKNLLTGQVKKSVYEVHGPRGIYATLDSLEDADIVAYGLNRGYTTSAMGGFSESAVKEIKLAMAK